MTWISFSEQTPEYGGQYLVTDGDLVTVAIYLEDEKLWQARSGKKWDGHNLTHWQPFPERPFDTTWLAEFASQAGWVCHYDPVADLLTLTLQIMAGRELVVHYLRDGIGVLTEPHSKRVVGLHLEGFIKQSIDKITRAQ